MATLVDSYSESNKDSETGCYGSDGKIAQSFTSNGGVLNSAKWYLKKTGSPTGSCYAAVYAHTGTYGATGKPTGTALAISNAFDVAILTTSLQLITFTFTGANKITLTNGEYYCLSFEYTSGNNSTKPIFGYDTSTPSHSGNGAYLFGGGWVSWSGDICFYVYKDDVTISPFPSHFNV
jgi:hypothetical protein